jgi:hypothetical protein
LISEKTRLQALSTRPTSNHIVASLFPTINLNVDNH